MISFNIAKVLVDTIYMAIEEGGRSKFLASSFFVFFSENLYQNMNRNMLMLPCCSYSLDPHKLLKVH